MGLIVVFLGFQVVRETAMRLMDTMPDDGSDGDDPEVGAERAGALDVEKCFARKTGLRYHVDLHLEVDPDLTVRDSHSIAEEVRNKVKADLLGGRRAGACGAARRLRVPAGWQSAMREPQRMERAAWKTLRSRDC